MTQDEAHELLNSMLIPTEELKRNVNANQSLTPNEEDLLLQVVIDFEAQSENYDYITALHNIADIMRRFIKQASVTAKSKKIVLNPASMPFLIQQVLFFIAVSCSLYKKNGKALASQKDIIGILKNSLSPLSISHNFFSRMNTTPRQYVSMKKYKQPELPITYKGQKKDELAAAIKNLVYQAGKYDVFCDIFGGSGAALLSVDRRKEAKYVYNELDKKTQNLFVVIEDDDKYIELIEALESLQLDLRGGEKWINSKFDTCVNTHVEKKNWKDVKEDEILENRKLLASEMKMSDAEKIKVMKYFRNIIDNADNDLVVKYAGKSYSKDELLNKIFVDCMHNRDVALENFREYFYFISELCYLENSKMPIYLSSYNVEVQDNNYKWQKIGLNHLLTICEQCRAYEYFTFFECVLNEWSWQPQDKIICAVAKIFMQSFSFYGDAQLSNILRMQVRYPEVEDTYEVFYDFVTKNFKEIITELHNTIKGTICDNLDCNEVIKKYESKNGKSNYRKPIFYSDSPYIATSNYDVKDADDNKSKFGTYSMIKLIETLKESGDRFIFSCRAVKGSNIGSKTTTELKESNKNIFDAVFVTFIDAFNYTDPKNNQKLWVLEITKQNEDSTKLIEDNKTLELMITNFEIHSFKDDAYPNTKFEAYEFSKLLKKLMLHSNAIVNEDWEEGDDFGLG